MAGWSLGLPAVQAAAKPLVFCADASPEGFDPSLWDAASTANATRPIFQGLLEFKRGSAELKPRLATAWQVSPDARTFTFQLRANVAFQTTAYFKPTRPFNASEAPRPKR